MFIYFKRHEGGFVSYGENNQGNIYINELWEILPQQLIM